MAWDLLLEQSCHFFQKQVNISAVVHYVLLRIIQKYRSVRKSSSGLVLLFFLELVQKFGLISARLVLLDHNIEIPCLVVNEEDWVELEGVFFDKGIRS